MKIIKLDYEERVPSQNSSSKGNQPKWKVKKNWYKADFMGYEALAEVVISRLLKLSNLNDFVEYKPVMLEYDDKRAVGCISVNFREKNMSLITLEHLYRAYNGKSLSEALGKLAEVKDRVEFTVNFIEETTGLKNAGAYLATLIELDAFFLNEDRHTNNIALLYNEDSEQYAFAPVFDNGLALLSDLNDYPADEDIFSCMKRIKAKPFSTDFDEQLDAAEELYGCQVRFSFTNKDVELAFEDMAEYYDGAVISRAKNILFQQMRKYGYMFE